LSRVFSLAIAPLVRIHLLHVSDHELRLVLTDCHAVLDGWSLTSIVADLLDLHRRMVTDGAEPELPAAPRFAEYVALERAAREGKESLAFWAKELAALTPLHLIRRGAAAAENGAAGAHEARRSFAHLTEPMGQLARRAGVPRRTVLLGSSQANPGSRTRRDRNTQFIQIVST
jgi:hypothetical protein